MSKNNFLFYKEWDVFLESLTDEQAGRLIKAMCAHARGVNVDVSPDILGIYNYIASSMDRLEVKYAETCEKRRENGRKGGLQRVANASKSKQMLPNASKSKQKQANPSDIDIDTDIDIDRDIGIGMDGYKEPSIETIADLLQPRLIKVVK